MDNNQKEQMKKAVKDLASHTEKAASMAKDKISQQMEQENVKKAAETAAKGARKASEGLTAFMEEGKKGTDKKRTIILAVTAVIGSCILGALGFAWILGWLLLISLGVLIYRAVKKKQKKNAAIATAIFFAMGGIAGMFGNKGVPGNVLDYLGTKENVVYQTYDKEGFQKTGERTITNADTYIGDLPIVTIYDGKVYTVKIDKNSKNSFHVNGLHVGDDLKRVEECMKELGAVPLQTDNSMIWCTFSHKGSSTSFIIGLSGGYVDELIVTDVFK